jgi:hypothetical protein
MADLKRRGLPWQDLKDPTLDINERKKLLQARGALHNQAMQLGCL